MQRYNKRNCYTVDHSTSVDILVVAPAILTRPRIVPLDGASVRPTGKQEVILWCAVRKVKLQTDADGQHRMHTTTYE